MARIVIIGAGVGGLCAAARLAHAGHDVTVFERDAQPGGKLNRLVVDGFSFDTGPSLLTMPHVFRDLWTACGRDFDADVPLFPLDPLCRYHWTDGACLDASPHLPTTAAGISKLSPRDVPGFFAFMGHAANIHALTKDSFLGEGVTGILDLCRRNPGQIPRIPQLDAFRTMHAATSSFFHDPRLVQLFDRYATYTGSSPYRAPATLCVIPWVEWGGGGYYVCGGMYRLAEALARLATAMGASIRPNTPVAGVLTHEGRVTGVELDHGQEFKCDAVVMNADAISGTRALLPSRVRPRLNDHRLDELEPSTSGFVLLLSVKGDLPNLAHHNIYFSADYKREFDQLVEERVPAGDPTVYVCASSVSDSSQAPPGHHNLFVLVNAPNTLGPMDWDTVSDAYRNVVLNKLAAMGLDVGDRIVVERRITPFNFERRFHANRGSIYGLSSNSRNTAFERPPNRSQDVKGLYYAGGAAHPGGGLPLVALSGALAARLLQEDLARL